MTQESNQSPSKNSKIYVKYGIIAVLLFIIAFSFYRFMIAMQTQKLSVTDVKGFNHTLYIDKNVKNNFWSINGQLFSKSDNVVSPSSANIGVRISSDDYVPEKYTFSKAFWKYSEPTLLIDEKEVSEIRDFYIKKYKSYIDFLADGQDFNNLEDFTRNIPLGFTDDRRIFDIQYNYLTDFFYDQKDSLETIYWQTKNNPTQENVQALAEETKQLDKNLKLYNKKTVLSEEYTHKMEYQLNKEERENQESFEALLQEVEDLKTASNNLIVDNKY